MKQPPNSMPMCYSLIRMITVGLMNLCIRTRIGRWWEHRTRENEIVNLHMVLVDEEGEIIHASVPKNLIPKFHSQLKEGGVYYFQHCKSTRVVAKMYRSVHRDCEVSFTPKTVVTPILPDPDGFPLYAYRLRGSFQDIRNTVMDRTYLLDVVGLVTGISNVVTINKPQMAVRLFDGRNDAIITLWDEFASLLDADDLICQSKREHIILLAMGCAFKKPEAVGCAFKMPNSVLALQSCYGFSICINPAISDADVSAFRDRISQIDHSIERIDHRGQRVDVSAVQNTNLGSSSAGHKGSHVDDMSASDPVTVWASQEHSAEPSCSVDLEKNKPAGGEMPRTPAVRKRRATPHATLSGMKRKTRSSSKAGDNPRGRTEDEKEKMGKAPKRPKKPLNYYCLFQNWFVWNYKVENPKGSISRAMICKEARAKWDGMMDVDKKPYFDEYERQLAEYKRQLAEYERQENAHNNSDNEGAPAVGLKVENAPGTADDPQHEHGAEALEEWHTDGNNGQEEEVEHGGGEAFEEGHTDGNNGQEEEEVEHGDGEHLSSKPAVYLFAVHRRPEVEHGPLDWDWVHMDEYNGQQVEHECCGEESGPSLLMGRKAAMDMDQGLVSVDKFSGGSQVYFLTHLHRDHTGCLRAAGGWRQGPLYCSPVTASLLPTLFPGIDASLVRPINPGDSASLPLSLSGHDISIQVTAIPALHCPGSLMYLFRSDLGCMLYTGDFRWELECEEALSAKKVLLDTLAGDSVDVLYMDNTYCHLSLNFPPRHVVADEIVGFIRAHPHHEVIIGVPPLGKEELLLHIARELQTKICVLPQRLRTIHLVGIDVNEEMFTTQSRLTRVRAVPSYSLTVENLEALNTVCPTIGIMASGIPWLWRSTLVTAGEMDLKLPGGKDLYALPYSDHACFPELEDFMQTVAPSKVVGILNKSSFCPRHHLRHLCGDIKKKSGHPKTGSHKEDPDFQFNILQKQS